MTFQKRLIKLILYDVQLVLQMIESDYDTLDPAAQKLCILIDDLAYVLLNPVLPDTQVSLVSKWIDEAYSCSASKVNSDPCNVVIYRLIANMAFCFPVKDYAWKEDLLKGFKAWMGSLYDEATAPELLRQWAK